MKKITKYLTFDDKEFPSFELARRHLINLDNEILNKLSFALTKCDVSKISNPLDRDFLIKSEDCDSFMFRRHYILYYLDENLHLFDELKRIREDLNVIDNEDLED